MSWKVVITGSAKEDIRTIKKWYRQESTQAAENFSKEIAEALESLQSDRIEHRLIYGNYRRLSLNKYPYVIFYQRRQNENIVEVNAVFHTHRDLATLRKHLSRD